MFTYQVLLTASKQNQDGTGFFTAGIDRLFS